MILISPRMITIKDATICPNIFFSGTRHKTSSFKPRKNRIMIPARMNLNSDDSAGKVKRMVEIDSPPNIARPPSIGISLSCEILPLVALKIFLCFAIFTIAGIGKNVIENDSRKAPVRTSHSGSNEAKEMRFGLKFLFIIRS